MGKKCGRKKSEKQYQNAKTKDFQCFISGEYKVSTVFLAQHKGLVILHLVVGRGLYHILIQNSLIFIYLILG
jgi:hypothetical protein